MRRPGPHPDITAPPSNQVFAEAPGGRGGLRYGLFHRPCNVSKPLAAVRSLVGSNPTPSASAC
jgi:hypothetical protein